MRFQRYVRQGESTCGIRPNHDARGPPSTSGPLMTELLSKDHTILERPFMEFLPFGVDAQGEKISDISGVIVLSNIEYLYDFMSLTGGPEAAERAVHELCRLLNERIHDPAYHVTPEFLRNAWNSYSYEFGCYLREFCEALSGDPQFHFKAARVRKVPQIIQILLRPFSTQQSYRMWAYVGQKYTKGVLEFGVGNVTNRSAILRMRFTEKAVRQFGSYRKRCVDVICQSCKAGIAGAQQQIHGLTPADVRDLSCIANGDEWCESGVYVDPEDALQYFMAIVGLSYRNDVCLSATFTT